MKKQIEQPEQPGPTAGDEQRRELLIKLGKVAVYTPPALLALMLSRKATAVSLGDPPGPG